MDSFVHIDAAAKRLGVTPKHPRVLQWELRIPPVTRDFSHCVYLKSDIAHLKSMGVGSRPSKLKRAEEVVEVAE